MKDAQIDYRSCLDSNPACAGCTTICCSTAGWGFPPPPLSPREVTRLREYLGRDTDQFVTPGTDHSEIREGADGNCAFLDPVTQRCIIYPVRPYDCRSFPFDFITSDPREGHWILWQCPASEHLDDSEIERHLRHLETHYTETIRSLWWYNALDRQENSIYREARHRADETGLASIVVAGQPRTFRLLRRIGV